MPSYPRLLTVGDAAWTVEFGDAIEPELNDRVLAFADAVERLQLDGIIETVPTYRSATIYFDPIRVEAIPLGKQLLTIATSLPLRRETTPHRVEIPVCYGGEFGPDLPDVAAWAGLSVEQVASRHASAEYRVYLLGFSPGFPYMGRVPDAIAVPRLPAPRSAIAAGSVGIAGHQTGIYPQRMPGGWRLIGRTPIGLYDPSRSRPFLLQAGDRVRFVAIDRSEFDRLESLSHSSLNESDTH